MLNIWIGRAGSGKSKHVLDAIQFNKSYRPQILLTPENCSHEAEMDVCRVCGATASRDVSVITFKSLSMNVLSETGGLSDFTLDNAGKMLTIRQCIQELSEELKVFGNPSQRTNFLKELTSITDELYAYDIQPDTFTKAVNSIKNENVDKLLDIAKIYTLYDRKMHQDDFDSRSYAQKLSDQIWNSKYFNDKDLYIDGFTYFNKQEEKVIRCALQRCHSVTITLLGEKENEYEFLNANKERDTLLEVAKELNVPVEIINFNKVKVNSLDHLEKTIFGDDEIYCENTDQIALYEAGSIYTEVEYIASEIRRLTRTKGYRYRDIGVCVRNLEQYSPLFHALFQREDIPFYESRRSSILDKPIISMLLHAVSAVTGGFELDDVFRYLKTGLTTVSMDDIDILENYCLTWKIRGKQWTQDKDWTMHPEGYMTFLDADRTYLERINKIRQQVYQPLKTLYNGIKGTSNILCKTKSLYSFIIENNVPKMLKMKTEELRNNGHEQQAEEYSQLWELLCQILDQFVEILGDLNVNADEYSKLLHLLFAQYTIGTIPATVDQVKVSEITRNDRHRVKVMYLLGANDNVIPTVPNEGLVLNNSDRNILSSVEVMLSDNQVNRMDEELQNIYACIAQPTEHLHISWPTVDEKGIELRPSFIVKRIEKLYPNIQRKKEDLKYRYTMPSTAIDYAFKPNSNLYQFFANSPTYARAMEAIEHASKMQLGKLSQEAISLLYGRKVPVSASKLETMNHCKFKYFMEYGLKVKERKIASFDASSYGTFIHYILENVTREVNHLGGYKEVDDKVVKELTDTYVKAYIEELLHHFEEKPKRFQYLFNRLKNYAETILLDLSKELRKSEFKPLDFELQIGGSNSEVPPIEVSDNTTTLSLSGKIDRVDGWIHDGKLYIRVVDYKTGKKSFDLTDIKYGLGLQMLIYLFALDQHGKDKYHLPIVPAGVLYMPSKDDLFTIDRNASDEEIASLRTKESKRKGLILNDLDVIEAMESDSLTQSDYLPITIKKDGSISSGIASLEQFGKLSKYVDKTLHQLCGEFSQGNVEALPIYRSSTNHACQFCKYATACYFVKNENAVKHMKTCKEEEFWDYIDKEIQ